MKNCLDCGKEIDRRSQRCRPCSKNETNHPAWKGGRTENSLGRIIIRINGKPIQESHYIWLTQNNLGLNVIPKGCCIHHINGNKKDNRIENLMLLPKNYHDWSTGKFNYPEGSKFGINSGVDL